MGNITKIADKTNKKYIKMSNQSLHVTNMSLQAKGLLSVLWSLPKDWQISISELGSICKESQQTIKKILDELTDLGYLNVEKRNPSNKQEGGTGGFTYEYFIRDISSKPDKLSFPWESYSK